MRYTAVMQEPTTVLWRLVRHMTIYTITFIAIIHSDALGDGPILYTLCALALLAHILRALVPLPENSLTIIGDIGVALLVSATLFLALIIWSSGS